MENSINAVLDIASKSRQLHKIDLNTMTYSWTKIKSLKSKQVDYKIICQLSNDQLMCCYYDKSLKAGKILYINSNGTISYGACFDLTQWFSWSTEYLYKRIKGIKYKNYVYVLQERRCILKYNLLKNTYVAILNIGFQRQSCAIIEDRILIIGEFGRGIIYDCSVNSISTLVIFKSYWSKCIGTSNRAFFVIDSNGFLIKSEELNPYKWILLGKIILNHIDLTVCRMVNYENLTYFFSKGNLYKFDLENLDFTKIHFALGKKEACSEYKMLSLRFKDIENNIELNNWAQAFKPIEHYFHEQNNYIEWILNMHHQPYEFPIKFLFEYPVFEDRKVIILIQDSNWLSIRNSLKNYLELFGPQKTYLKSFYHIDNFGLYCLKNWLKQGVIVLNLHFMDWKRIKPEEIIEALKNGKRGLIWVLIGLDSRIYYDCIDQNEDKVILGYVPENNAFQKVNDILREAGEKEIDLRVWL